MEERIYFTGGRVGKFELNDFPFIFTIWMKMKWPKLSSLSSIEMGKNVHKKVNRKPN